MEPDADVRECAAFRPASVEELASRCAQTEGAIHLSPGKRNGLTLDLGAMHRVLSFEPEDQVVAVEAGISLLALDAALRARGQCLPFVCPLDSAHASIGALLSANRPHLLEGFCGMWRDWVLGLTVVQANGIVAKTGSKAVKSVAGYDVQKLLIGARGTLGIVAEVILKTFPVRALPTPNTLPGAATGPRWIQRVLRTDFDAAIRQAGSSLVVADRETSTLWLADGMPKRFEYDWLMPTQGAPEVPDPTTIHFMRRAKALFDPTGKLNPGAMGIF